MLFGQKKTAGMAGGFFIHNFLFSVTQSALHPRRNKIGIRL